MGHITSKNAYKSLEERINWFTQGAPATETFRKILEVLYTEDEAKAVSQLPVRPFTIRKAAKIWGMTEAQAEKTLDLLCVEGNGASISTLMEAGARTADLVIAVTNYDGAYWHFVI